MHTRLEKPGAKSGNSRALLLMFILMLLSPVGYREWVRLWA